MISNKAVRKFYLLSYACIVASILLLAANIRAQSISQGDAVSKMLKLKGKWRGKCERAGRSESAGYRLDQYQFSMIDLAVTATIYKTAKCRQELTSWRAKYRFGIGQEIFLKSGERVTELNLQEVDDPADAWDLPPFTIYHQSSGKLFLGLAVPGNYNASTRILNLDKQNPLIRHY